MAAAIDVPDEAKLLSGLYNNIGLMVSRDGAVATGVAMLRRAVALDPLDPGRRVNLASQLIGLGEDDEAEALLTAALSQDASLVAAWQMMGTLKTHRGQLREAIKCFERSLALAPDHGQAKFDLAAAYLRAGDFARGLPLYEHRAEILPRAAPPPPAACWTGEKVGHLCVWGDQGYGDRVLFARFLPWARERCDKLTFLTDPYTVPLLQGYRQLGEVGCFYAPDTVFDAQICLSSLPLIYGLTPDNVPPDPGLLTPAATAGRLGTPGLKIGLAWAGNRDHPNDSIRSMPFTELLVLAADPRNDLFSVQCGPPAGDIAKARAQRLVSDLSGMIEGEWSHTAAVLQSLDLLVTVDTAVAHIAGALSVKTFLLLPLFCDWRWLWGRDDTPWYPTVRLFRQAKARDWRGVMVRVTAAVAQIHQERAMTRAINAAIRGEPTPGAAADGPPANGAAALLVDGVYEPDVAHLMQRVLRPGDCCVDVGANVGLHALRAAELVGPQGTVLAFEPGSNNLPTLMREVGAKDSLGVIEVVVKPIWHKAEQVRFHLCADGGGGDALWDPGEHPANTLAREQPESSLMMATTLDAELEARGLRPRLIKIDTEGAEQRVLEGAIGTLFELHPPFIVAELHEFGLRKLGCSQQGLFELMMRAGYEAFALFVDGSKPRLLPPGGMVVSRYVVNLLFSTQRDVDAMWPGETASDHGRVVAYSWPRAESAA
jgi:FkbM family methyltransferase